MESDTALRRGLLAAAWLTLQYANLLVAVTALLISLPVSALLVLLRAEHTENRNLRRFVTQATNLPSHRVPLKDHGRMHELLGSTARILGIDRHLVIEQRGRQLQLLYATPPRSRICPATVRRSSAPCAVRYGQVMRLRLANWCRN